VNEFVDQGSSWRVYLEKLRCEPLYIEQMQERGRVAVSTPAER
jgi:hypothetical protein